MPLCCVGERSYRPELEMIRVLSTGLSPKPRLPLVPHTHIINRDQTNDLSVVFFSASREAVVPYMLCPFPDKVIWTQLPTADKMHKNSSSLLS